MAMAIPAAAEAMVRTTNSLRRLWRWLGGTSTQSMRRPRPSPGDDDDDDVDDVDAEAESEENPPPRGAWGVLAIAPIVVFVVVVVVGENASAHRRHSSSSSPAATGARTVVLVERAVMLRSSMGLTMPYGSNRIIRFCGWWLEFFSTKLYMWAISYCHF
jgi:hypothetical protein